MYSGIIASQYLVLDTVFTNKFTFLGLCILNLSRKVDPVFEVISTFENKKYFLIQCMNVKNFIV
jgi:hypothetical protein